MEKHKNKSRKMKTVTVISIIAALISFLVWLQLEDRVAPVVHQPAGIDDESTQQISKQELELTESLPPPSEIKEIKVGDQEVISNADSIFEHVDIESVSQATLDKFVTGNKLDRYRFVRVNADPIKQLIIDPSAEAILQVEPFPGVTLTSYADKRTYYEEGQRAGFYSWRGDIDHKEHSQMHIQIAPSGEIRLYARILHGSTYRVRGTDEPGIHIVTQGTTVEPIKVD